MAGAAPDATSLLHLTSPAANDAALKALLGSAAGKNFRVGPEHFLAKSAGDTAIVVGPDGNDFLVSWPRLDWLILRAVDIKGNWLLRPAFSGQCFMDWQVDSSLVVYHQATSKHADEHAAAVENGFGHFKCGCALAKARGDASCLDCFSKGQLRTIHQDTYGVPGAPHNTHEILTHVHELYYALVVPLADGRPD